MKYINKERVGLVLILAALLLNPLTNQYVQQGFDWGMTEASKFAGIYATIAASVYVVGLMVWYNYKAGKLNIPPKTSKKRTEKYLEA